MHMFLAGKFSPGRMQSFKMEFHRVFETPRWGVERKSSTGLTSQSRPNLSLSKSIPALGPLRGSKSSPPTFTGADSSIRAVCTHLLPLAPQLENQPYGKRQTTSSLTLPAPLFSWVCAGTAGTQKPAFSVQLCAIFFKS